MIIFYDKIWLTSEGLFHFYTLYCLLPFVVWKVHIRVLLILSFVAVSRWNICSRMDSLFDTSDESLLRWRMSVEEEENNIVDDEDSTAEPLLKTVVWNQSITLGFCYLKFSVLLNFFLFRFEPVTYTTYDKVYERISSRRNRKTSVILKKIW